MIRKEKIINTKNTPIGDAKKSPLGDLGVKKVGKVGGLLRGILLRLYAMNRGEQKSRLLGIEALRYE